MHSKVEFLVSAFVGGNHAVAQAATDTPGQALGSAAS